MADKVIQMHIKNENGTYDMFYPVSNADLIKTNDGKNVQDHIDNTDIHTKQIEKNKWNATSNTWVATAVTMSDLNCCYTLTIPNFVFTEGCKVTFNAPIPPNSEISYYNWISINNVGYALRSLLHEALTGDEWVANTPVTVALSSQKIHIKQDNDERNGSAFLIGSSSNVGSILSASTPSHPKNGMIWINGSGVAKFWNGNSWQNIAAVWG